MPIRILHVVDNMGMGGMQNGLSNLVAHLDPQRFEHVICGMRFVKEEDLQPLPAGRAQLLCLNKPAANRGIHFSAFVRMIREVQPDIVHSRNWGAIEAVFAARWTGTQTIHSEHGIDSTYALREPRRRSLLRRVAFEQANRVVSVSHQLRDLHALRTGFPSKRIAVIHNGVDRTRFFPDPSVRMRAREELRIPPDDFCLGCIGNLTPVKDHITLLKAMDQITRVHPRWRVIIGGDGPELTRLRDFADQRPEWRERVLFLGRCQNVQEILNAMDVYVLPSLSEGICNSLLEAMSVGLPAVATAAGGNTEVVVDQVSGFLFPVGDSGKLAELLIRLAGDSALRGQIGCQAVHRVKEDFSLDAMIHNYAALYGEVNAKPKTR